MDTSTDIITYMVHQYNNGECKAIKMDNGIPKGPLVKCEKFFEKEVKYVYVPRYPFVR